MVIRAYRIDGQIILIFVKIHKIYHFFLAGLSRVNMETSLVTFSYNVYDLSFLTVEN